MLYRDSWLVSENYIIKISDKSVFFSNSTGIPRETVLEWLQKNGIFTNGEDSFLNLYFHNRVFSSRIKLNKAKRVVMFFSKDFVDLVRSTTGFAYTLDDLNDSSFKSYDYPLIKFTKSSNGLNVEVCRSNSIQNNSLKKTHDCDVEETNIFVYQDIKKTLVRKDPPKFQDIVIQKKARKDRVPKKRDYVKSLENSIKTGLEGELRVIDYLRKEILDLEGIMMVEIEKIIEHSSLVDDSLGYDIVIYNADGTKKYIEVKTTKASALTPFYLSKNEIEFSSNNSDSYCLYRLYNFQYSSMTIEYYMITGNLKDQLHLFPIQYAAYPKQ